MIRPPHLLAALCMQVLNYGSCIDAGRCWNDDSCTAITGGTSYEAQAAWGKVDYSAAMAWFPAGATHTALIRVENPLGCGGEMSSAWCFANGNVAVQLFQGKGQWVERCMQAQLREAAVALPA